MEFTKFVIRVTYARYLPRKALESLSPPAVAWTIYNNTWNYTINNNTPVTFNGLKDVFRERGQAQYIDYLLRITRPEGRGCWIIATNWLITSNPIPQI